MLTENQQGIIFMFFSVICFSTMDILVKFLSASYPIFQLVLFRGVFGLIPILFIIPKNRYKNLFYTSKIKLHSIRAIAGALAMIFLFLGLKYLPIADAIAISFAAPVFATIFSIIFLNEIVRIFRWIAIITGLVGVIIILKPGTDLFSFYAIYPILFCIGFRCNIYSNQKTFIYRTRLSNRFIFYYCINFCRFNKLFFRMGDY